MIYTIISADNPELLIKKVNDLLEQGWETDGGVAIAPNGTFYQTMIQFDQEADEFDQSEEF